MEPILSQSGTVLNQCNLNNVDVGTIETISFGNFATTLINVNKGNFYLLQNETDKDNNASIYK